MLILSGDHIYKQDYRDLLRFHEAKGADLTVAVMHVPPEETFRFGIMTIDDEQRIAKFTEKPKKSDSTLASMGIYVFNTRFPAATSWTRTARTRTRPTTSARTSSRRWWQKDKVFAYPFSGYWVDVGTIQSYWETNLAPGDGEAGARSVRPGLGHPHPLEGAPAVKLGPAGQSRDSLVSNGCVIDGTVVNSVLSPGVWVEQGAVVRDSVIMNDTVIRAGAVVDKCVLDKEIEIGARRTGRRGRRQDAQPA